MSFYFYTETAFHHEGDYDYLVKLIDESKDIGVNGIKFQVLFELNSLTSSSHSKYNELSKLIIDQLKWKSVFERSINYGLDLIVMPLDCSVFEGFGRSLIEAQSYGTPVICFKTKSNFEILSNTATYINSKISNKNLIRLINKNSKITKRHKGLIIKNAERFNEKNILKKFKKTINEI